MWLPRMWQRGLPAAVAAATAAEGFRYGIASPQQPLQERKFATACQQEQQRRRELVRVSYTSTMRGDSATARKVIEGITERSVTKNLRANVSGHLCYDEKLRSVWQVIEGRHDAIANLWEQISGDARHIVDEDSVQIQEVDSRRYPLGWGMRYISFDEPPGNSDAAVKEPSNRTLMQLTYKSRIADNGGVERDVLEELVPAAMTKNARIGVTGWMLYIERTLTVYQVLEGPEDVVERLWDSIRNDPRHSVCPDTVRRKAIDKREYENWSMAMDEVELPAWIKQSY